MGHQNVVSLPSIKNIWGFEIKVCRRSYLVKGSTVVKFVLLRKVYTTSSTFVKLVFIRVIRLSWSISASPLLYNAYDEPSVFISLMIKGKRNGGLTVDILKQAEVLARVSKGLECFFERVWP